MRALRTNFRSRPEILDALNAAFAPHWDEDFQPLEPGGGRQRPPPTSSSST